MQLLLGVVRGCCIVTTLSRQSHTGPTNVSKHVSKTLLLLLICHWPD